MKRLRALKTAWERRRYGSSNAELVAAWRHQDLLHKFFKRHNETYRKAMERICNG